MKQNKSLFSRFSNFNTEIYRLTSDFWGNWRRHKFDAESCCLWCYYILQFTLFFCVFTPHSWPEIWDILSMLYFSLKFPFMLRHSWGIRFFHFAKADVGVSSQKHFIFMKQNCQNLDKIVKIWGKIVQVWVQKFKISKESYVKENKIVRFIKKLLDQSVKWTTCTASTDAFVTGQFSLLTTDIGASQNSLCATDMKEMASWITVQRQVP